MKLKLYTNSHSVTCSKIEVVIDFKSLEIEKIEAINNYGAFSPTATVPCLSIDNNMISDSSSIIEYFEEAFSSPSLLTKDVDTNIFIRFQATLVDEKLISTIRKLFSFVKNTSHPSDSMMIDNIFKEIESDLGIKFKETDGDLSVWSKQGVMLLNATLTVKQGLAGSHQNKGWESFTDRVLSLIHI